MSREAAPPLSENHAARSCLGHRFDDRVTVFEQLGFYFGANTGQIRRPDGALVPDRREPRFSIPDFVSVPDILKPHLNPSAEGASDFPYRVEYPIHFSNGGGVYVARNLATGERVVLREARPHAGLDGYGQDAVAQIEKGAVIRALGIVHSIGHEVAQRRKRCGQAAAPHREAVAFHDVNPQAPTHILVVPRKHLASLHECGPADAPLLGHLLTTTRGLAVSGGLHPSGYRIVLNTGAEAGQTVFHLHFHLLGGRSMGWPPG